MLLFKVHKTVHIEQKNTGLELSMTASVCPFMLVPAISLIKKKTGLKNICILCIYTCFLKVFFVFLTKNPQANGYGKNKQEFLFQKFRLYR